MLARVFVWIGVHQGIGLMGDVYVFAKDLAEAKSTLKIEFAAIAYPEFWQRLLTEPPTSTFENPMTWIDEYCEELNVN